MVYVARMLQMTTPGGDIMLGVCKADNGGGLGWLIVSAREEIVVLRPAPEYHIGGVLW